MENGSGYMEHRFSYVMVSWFNEIHSTWYEFARATTKLFFVKHIIEKQSGSHADRLDVCLVKKK